MAKARVMAATPPRWQRLEPDARREEILDAAMQLFDEKPYDAVSTTEIALKAGVARGLINHYFGDKRDLYYAVVKRLLAMPGLEAAVPRTGSLRTRVERCVRWYLDTVELHGKAYVAATGAGGLGSDPVLERIIEKADDRGSAKTLEFLDITAEANARQRATIHAYGGLVKATVREWIQKQTLTRDEAHLLLSEALLTIVRDVLPKLPAPRGSRTKPKR